MASPDSEHLAAAELLYRLAERLREELLQWPASTDGPNTVRETLYNAVDIIEGSASLTARGVMTLTRSDAIAESGELTLRKIIGMRKLRDSIWPPPK